MENRRAIDFLSTMPRVKRPLEFIQDPLLAFKTSREQFGNTFLLQHGRSLFSQNTNCAGSVAALGESNLKFVLSNPEIFGMPEPLAVKYQLPARLSRLNTSLFSMEGDEHQKTQRVFAGLLNQEAIKGYEQSIAEGILVFLSSWQSGKHINLLSEMRRLVLQVTARVVFGGSPEKSVKLGALVQRYFIQRRKYATHDSSELQRERLIAIGIELDESLTSHIVEIKQESAATNITATKVKHGADQSVLLKLCLVRTSRGEMLSDSELKTHINVLFMSGSEPIAVALSWTLLLMSQTPNLRYRLRQDLSYETSQFRGSTKSTQQNLNHIIKETLRLLPPNAIMTRFTRQDTHIDSNQIPTNSEILLSPYLVHRERECYANPNTFYPQRWKTLKVGPFQYMPFGNGHRHCLGRLLATRILNCCFSTLTAQYDIRLAQDQVVDWGINVNLMPAEETTMLIDKTSDNGGKLKGPVSLLLNIGVD